MSTAIDMYVYIYIYFHLLGQGYVRSNILVHNGYNMYNTSDTGSFVEVLLYGCAANTL